MVQCYRVRENWLYKFSGDYLRLRVCILPNQELIHFEVMTKAELESWRSDMRIGNLIPEIEFNELFVKTEKIISERFGLTYGFKSKPTYEQILQLKKEYEDEIYRKPKLVDSGAFYRKDDRRILQTAVMLAECDIPYTVQKYKDYLRKKSIPLSYLEKINNYLNEHYNQK